MPITSRDGHEFRVRRRHIALPHGVRAPSDDRAVRLETKAMVTAPRDGVISGIHFEPGDTFDKNAVLVTLIEQEEA